MLDENKQGRKAAENAVSDAENLQENEKVSNFAKSRMEARRKKLMATAMEKRPRGLRLYVDPLSDIGFKIIFGRENVMRAFLNDLIQPKSPIRQIIFLDKEMKSGSFDGRGIVYDMRCKTADGSEFIVEMQKRDMPNMMDRIIYYMSRTISRQGSKGKPDTGDNWDYKLDPVYGVFILNFNMPRMQKQMMRRFEIVDTVSMVVGSKKVCAYTIELPSIKRRKPEECKTNIERWIYNLYNMRTTTTKLPFDDLQPIFKEVASVAELANMSPDDYNQYMDVIDYYRTTRAAYEMDRQKSYAKGLTKGVAKGKAEGAKEEKFKNAKAMKDLGSDSSFIAQVTGLSLQEIAEL